MAEQRLIDADYAKYALKFIPYIDYSQTDRVIDECPTVDAVPVVHGHWEKIIHASLEDRCYRCSVCGKEIITNGIDRTNKCLVATAMNPYCRWCGAKMDEKVGEQDER